MKASWSASANTTLLLFRENSHYQEPMSRSISCDIILFPGLISALGVVCGSGLLVLYPRARFSKVPKTFRIRKAIRKTDSDQLIL